MNDRTSPNKANALGRQKAGFVPHPTFADGDLRLCSRRLRRRESRC